MIKIVYMVTIYEEDYYSHEMVPFTFGVFSDRKVASRVHEFYYKKFEEKYKNSKLKFRIDVDKVKFDGMDEDDYKDFVKMFPELKKQVREVKICSL